MKTDWLAFAAVIAFFLIFLTWAWLITGGVV